MINFEKIKLKIESFFKGKSEKEYFNKIKKSIIKNEHQIIIENIDSDMIINKDILNEYISSLLKKYSMCSCIFSNCNIDNINITPIGNQSVQFKNCKINNLLINNNEKSIVYFRDCIFDFSDNDKEQTIKIKIDNINLDNCIIDIKSNKKHILEFGKGITSSINCKNQRFINVSIIPFSLCMNANNITLSNYVSANNIRLLINKNNKVINYLHLINSSVIFNKEDSSEVNMMLVENTNVNNLYTECESIEISGNCKFNNVKILKANDMVLKEDSSLTIRDGNLNIKYLECLENSEINDITNRFKWLTNIDKIITNKNFKLKYNNTIMYKKEKEYTHNDNDEEDIYIASKVIRLR